jgi:hypothetical protein
MYGFMAAPAVPPVVIAVSEKVTHTQDIFGVVGLLIFGYGYSALCLMAFGGPVYWLLRRFRMIKWWTVILTGTIGGLLVYLLVAGFSPQPTWILMTYVLAGSLSSLCFWVIRCLGTDAKS